MGQKQDTTKKLAIGTSLAAAAGFVAGILTAPKSGKETRRDIKKAAKDGVNRVEAQFNKTHEQLNSALEEAQTKAGQLSGKARDELNAAVDKAKAAKDKAQTVFSSMRGGGVEDKDLQKALDGVKEALDHLKSYLKK